MSQTNEKGKRNEIRATVKAIEKSGVLAKAAAVAQFQGRVAKEAQDMIKERSKMDSGCVQILY